MEKRKIFRAVTDTVCEKAWLNEWDNKPDGWHWSTADALAAYKPKRGPGRPRKEEAADTPETTEEAEA